MRPMTLTSTSMYFLALAAFFCIPAQAYVDPGTGGLLLQGLIAISVGIVFHVLRFFGIVKPKKSNNNQINHGNAQDFSTDKAA